MSDFYNIGVGIDLVDINRFKERPYSTNQSFYKKIFSDVKFNKSFIITDSVGRMKDSEVGVTVVNNKATCFAYGLDTKWCQMAFLKGKEYDIMRSIALKWNKSTFYTFEALNLIVEKHGNLTAFEPEQMFIKEIDSMKDLK